MLSLAVVTVVGGFGLITLDESLVVTGLIVGALIMTVNLVWIALSRWHRGNTLPESTQVGAEDVVRLRRAQPRR